MLNNTGLHEWQQLRIWNWTFRWLPFHWLANLQWTKAAPCTTPNQQSLTTAISKDGHGLPAITLKPVPSPPILLPSISHICIGANCPHKVILCMETIMDEAEDLKSSAICKHGVRTSVQQRWRRRQTGQWWQWWWEGQGGSENIGMVWRKVVHRCNGRRMWWGGCRRVDQCKWEGRSKIRALTFDEHSNDNVYLGVDSTLQYAMDDTKMTALPLPSLLDTNIGPHCLPQVRNTPHLWHGGPWVLGMFPYPTSLSLTMSMTMPNAHLCCIPCPPLTIQLLSDPCPFLDTWESNGSLVSSLWCSMVSLIPTLPPSLPGSCCSYQYRAWAISDIY